MQKMMKYVYNAFGWLHVKTKSFQSDAKDIRKTWMAMACKLM